MRACFCAIEMGIVRVLLKGLFSGVFGPCEDWRFSHGDMISPFFFFFFFCFLFFF